MTEKLIYVAGPYTVPEPVFNTTRAVDIAEELYDRSDRQLVPVVPHSTLAWNLVSYHDPGWWYEYDLKIMVRCDAVLRFSGDSIGADREVVRARELDMPVWFDLDALLEHYTRTGTLAVSL